MTVSPSSPGPAPAGALWFRRMGSPWRVAAYLAGCVGASLIWCGLLMLVLRPGMDVLVHPERYPLAVNAYLVGTYAILVGGALFAWRKLQGEPLAALGLGGSRRRVLEGLAWGFGSIGGLFALEWALGLIQWSPSGLAGATAGLLLANAGTAAFFAFSEELLFRGFIFQTLRRGLPLGWAIAGSSWFYAQVHFLRFDLAWERYWPPFAGLMLAGAMLAWVSHRSGSLWLAVGLHAAWVYMFFLSDRLRLFVYPADLNWLSGGGYPLGGLVGIGMTAALFGALAWRWRGIRD